MIIESFSGRHHVTSISVRFRLMTANLFPSFRGLDIEHDPSSLMPRPRGRTWEFGGGGKKINVFDQEDLCGIRTDGIACLLLLKHWTNELGIIAAKNGQVSGYALLTTIRNLGKAYSPLIHVLCRSIISLLIATFIIILRFKPQHNF